MLLDDSGCILLDNLTILRENEINKYNNAENPPAGFSYTAIDKE